MKNVLICSNCNTENSYYAYDCMKCNAFLRSKVANIDLWETIGKLIETPVLAAEKIIHSENKNFVITLLIFLCIKFAIIVMVIHNAFYNFYGNPITFLNGLIKGGIPAVILLIIVSFIVTTLNKYFGIKNRIKDNLAIYVYSFFPIIGGLMILTPIQFALFGEYWFTFNPSPLLIKPTASLILFIIEGLLFIWSGFLFATSTFTQTRNKVYSIFVGLFIIVVFAVMILLMCA